MALAEEFPHVYAAVGVHPSDCGEWGEGTLLELRQLASRPKVRAIGEIGLDYYWKDNPPRALQQMCIRDRCGMVLPGRGCGLRSPLGRFYLFPESVEEKGLQGQSHKSYVLSVGSTEGFTT